MASLRYRMQHLMPFAIASVFKRSINGKFTGLHGLRSLIPYSTSVESKDDRTMVEFLVKSVGFSEEEAVSIATNPKVSPRFKSTTKQSELIVDFLKSSGFNETHIRKLLTFIPWLLRCKVETTLKPKIRAFQELGLCGSDLVLVITQHPFVLKRGLKTHIVPVLETLKSLLGSNEQLIKLLLKTRSQLLLSNNVLSNLPDNLALLQSYGVPSGKVKQLLLQKRTTLLLMQSTQWFEKKLKAVEEKLGIPPTSGMFLHGFSALSSISEERLESLLQVFRSYGWSETEISTVLRKYPFTLDFSEKFLRVKLKYFMEELGYGSDFLASRPVLLALSLEKRIVPRTAVIQALKEKQLLKNNESYYTIMMKAESKFVVLYLLPFKDKLPQLFEYYMQQTSSSGGSISKT